MEIKKDLTFDHLLPKSKGGLTDWNNVVTACSSCNVKKGGKLYKDCDLKLTNKPYAPTVEDLHRNGRNFPPNFLHESWMDYLILGYRVRTLIKFFSEIVIAILEEVLITLSKTPNKPFFVAPLS